MSNNNLTVQQMASENIERIEADNQYKASVINSAIANNSRFTEITALGLEDLAGVAQAYKTGAITSEEEMNEQMRIYLEEYTVNLINMLKVNL
ncbi:hypothetical protein [Paenibacillus sp. sgz500958]|uniref:hypothetical protein n=1 Tax=Paenibacillus sp. sgz500958 TaxID=3242475 RepID=UPI0036D39E1A